MAEQMTTYLPEPCFLCGEQSKMRVPAEGLRQWQDGTHIQYAFPELSPEVREQIKTGIHPDCWEQAFGGMEDDDE